MELVNLSNTNEFELRYDTLSVLPLGGQSELGQMLWVISYGGEILLIDAGACYPSQDLPGVDLLLPNTTFLEANQERIQALILTNAHEEHCGAVPYILRHCPITKILAPRFVSAFLGQLHFQNPIISSIDNKILTTSIDTIELKEIYQIGNFSVEWIGVNDAIADACALRIGTPEGTIIYTSSFKLDQTPVDGRLIDVARLAQCGEKGVLLLLSASAGVESNGYSLSEKSVGTGLFNTINKAKSRVIVVMPGTNTHRLQILFDIAQRTGRKVLLVGEVLIRAAVAAAITGNLDYNPRLEAHLQDLEQITDSELLVVATGVEGEPIQAMAALASASHPDLTVKAADLVIFSADIPPGRSRQMAMILDQFLELGVEVVEGYKQKIHVPKHASREELKLMLSLTNPRYFLPIFGEGRHIMHHAQLALDWGMNSDAVFPLKNGEILGIKNGFAQIMGVVEAQAAYLNREQGERVTTFSVNERRNLSIEGVVTISLVIDVEGHLVSGPHIDAGASAFLNSKEWLEAKTELAEVVVNYFQQWCIDQGTELKTTLDNNGKLNQLKTSLKEVATKTVKTRLQAKPTLQIVLQQLMSTKRHPQQ